METAFDDHFDERQKKAGRLLSVCLVLLTAAWGFHVGARQYLANLEYAAFYQIAFDPAVNLVCTGRFEAVEPTDEVNEFLRRQSDMLSSCDGLTDQPATQPSSLHRTTAYLQLATAATWSVLGISWANLYPVAGVLVAFYGLATYWLVRAFAPSRLLAAALAVTTIGVQPAVAQMPHLRDFSKAPFVVMALALLAHAVLRQSSMRTRILLMFATGLVTALGLGFRADVQAILPLGILAPLLLTERSRGVAGNIQQVVVFWVALIAGYLLGRVPLSLLFADSAPTMTTAHVFVLGFADTFMLRTGMDRALYSAIATYKDLFVGGSVQIFHGSSDPLGFYDERYREASSALLVAYLTLFPFDVFMRVFYALVAFKGLPLLGLFIGIWLPPVLAVLWLHDMRRIVFLATVVAYFAAVLSLQYALRHTFFMSAIGAALIGLSIAAVIDLARRAWMRSFSGRELLIAATSFAGTLGMLALAAGGISLLLGRVQDRHVAELIARYDAIDWQPAPFHATEKGIALDAPERLGRGGLAKVEIQRTETDELPHLIPKISWKSQPKNELAVAPDGSLSVQSNTRGYAAFSTPFPPRGVSTGTPVKALLDFTYTSPVPLDVGILQRGKSWLALKRYPAARNKRDSLVADLPAGVDGIQLIFSRPGENNAGIELRDIALRDAAGACPSSSFAIAPNYTFGTETIDFIKMTAQSGAGDARYTFPLILLPQARFNELKLTDIPANCVKGWFVSPPDMSGLAPVAMLLVDGKLDRSRRASWKGVARQLMLR